jgi:hypothetical protein
MGTRVYEPPENDDTAVIETIEQPNGTRRQVVRTVSWDSPEHDAVEMTYTADGDVETVTYLLGTDVVRQLSMTYHSSGQLARVQRVV